MRTCTDGSPYPERNRKQVILLAQITTKLRADLSPVVHYVASEETDFDQKHWVEWLIVDEAIHYYRSLQETQASIKLQNLDGEVEAALAAEYWEGAPIILWEFFTNMGDGLTQLVEKVRGVLTRREADEETCSWNIVRDWDPQLIQAPARSVTRSCPLRFNFPEGTGNQCGYVGAETECNKTFSDCTTRTNTHRFGGFIQISQRLAVVYQPVSDSAFKTQPWLDRGLEPR